MVQERVAVCPLVIEFGFAVKLGIEQFWGGVALATVKLVTVAPWPGHPWFTVPRERPLEVVIWVPLVIQLLPWFGYQQVCPKIKAWAVGSVTWVIPRGIPPWSEVRRLVKVWTVEAVPNAGETDI